MTKQFGHTWPREMKAISDNEMTD